MANRGNRAVRVQCRCAAQGPAFHESDQVRQRDGDEQLLSGALDDTLVVAHMQQPVRRANRAQIPHEPVHPAAVGRDQVHDAAGALVHPGRRRMWASC